MSRVVPFRAVRPAKPYVRQVAAPPYDVLNAAEARELVRDNPLSFLHVEKSEIDLPDAAGVEDCRIYERAKENLDGMIRRGILFQERSPLFYLYRQQMGERIQTGIVACTDLAEYESGRILRHEFTRADKETERTLHIDTVGAQTGPVFMVYRGRTEIDRVSARVAERPPEYDFVTDAGVRHTAWIISDPAEIREVADGFARVENLYIADGHHRAAAAANVARLRSSRNPADAGEGEHRLLLSVLFPHDQLRIMDYNRAVRDLHGLTEGEFLKRVGDRFRIAENFTEKKPARPHEFGMYLNGVWRSLTASAEILREDDPVAGLDVSLLQENLLAPDSRHPGPTDRPAARIHRGHPGDGGAGKAGRPGRLRRCLFPLSPNRGADDGRGGPGEGHAAEIHLVRTQASERSVRPSPGVTMMEESLVREGERADAICGGRLRVIQRERGYRFSLDALLLAHFVMLREGDDLIDLGTGGRGRCAHPGPARPLRAHPRDRYPGGACGDGEAERRPERPRRPRGDPQGRCPRAFELLRAPLLFRGRLQPPLPASPVGADESGFREGRGQT